MRALALGLWLACAACAKEAPAETLPREDDFARHVLAVIETYPADGTHRYHWPKDDPWRGNVRTLRYDGEVISEGDPEGRCYCCGLTFEVFLQAWQRWASAEGRPERIPGLDAAGVRRLQTQWFGSPADRSCLRTAIVENGLGRRIETLEDARPGDFVQLWRTNGSGHSVVFLEWIRDDLFGSPGPPIGMRYWSTQRATSGIGRHSELFVGNEGGTLKDDELWICRIGRP